MADNIKSPFEAALGTPTSQPSMGSGMGAVPGPPPDYEYARTEVVDVNPSGASFDSPYNEAIVQSTQTVKSADPGGSAPMESPFTDRIAK